MDRVHSVIFFSIAGTRDPKTFPFMGLLSNQMEKMELFLFTVKKKKWLYKKKNSNMRLIKRHAR
jgi:hypothetical protein